MEAPPGDGGGEVSDAPLLSHACQEAQELIDALAEAPRAGGEQAGREVIGEGAASPSARSSLAGSVSDRQAFSPARARDEQSTQLASIQRQHQQRVNEITEASARIAQQKETEIRGLSETLSAERARAASEIAELRRELDVIGADKERMQREAEAVIKGLQAQLRAAAMAGGKSVAGAHDLASLGKRMQGALDAVRAAAEREIEKISRDRDFWREKCEKEGAGGGGDVHEKEGALMAEIERLQVSVALARNEVTSLTMQGTQEVMELKASLQSLVQQSHHNDAENLEEIAHLKDELAREKKAHQLQTESLQRHHDRQKMQLRAECGTSGHMGGDVHQQDSPNKRETIQSLERTLANSQRFGTAVAAQNDKLLTVLAELQQEIALVRAELDLVKGERDFLERDKGELEAEINRLDAFVYGKRNLSFRSSKRAGGSSTFFTPPKGSSRQSAKS